MKRLFFIKYILFVLLCLAISSLTIFSITKSENTTTLNPYSYLQLKVLNASNNLPIENATICILDNFSYYQTQKSGFSEMIKIPLVDSWRKSYCYEINLLIYKNGFCDFLYFNLKLLENQKRTDVVIYLEEIISEKIAPTIFIEPPVEATINSIIDAFKK